MKYNFLLSIQVILILLLLNYIHPMKKATPPIKTNTKNSTLLITTMNIPNTQVNPRQPTTINKYILLIFLIRFTYH